MNISNNAVKGMCLKMIESVWGNIRSREARKAWATQAAKRNKIEDQVFRHWLIGVGVPEDVAKKAWAQGSRKKAIKWLQHPDRKQWIEYYKIENEVNAAFIANTPK